MHFLKIFRNKVLLAVVLVTALIGATAVAMSQANKPAAFYPLDVVGDNQKRTFTVEFAETQEEQAKGLMFREELANDKGMLFIFPEPRETSFWMKNTLIPLDMIFIDADHKISFIHHKAQPHDETPVFSHGHVIGVLEIPGGQANSQNIKIGDIIMSPLLSGTAK